MKSGVLRCRYITRMAENSRKKPKKLGRPKLPEGEKKGFMLRVRMSPTLKEALEVAAKKEYLTSSEFVRQMLETRLGVK